MNNNRKARSAVAAASREIGSAKEQALSPEKNHNTKENENQAFPVADLLHHGEENAISAQKLLKISGFRTRREMSIEIERERLAGAFILSSSRRGGGYFLPSKGEKGFSEMRRFYNANKARAKSTFRSMRLIRLALKEHEACRGSDL